MVAQAKALMPDAKAIRADLEYMTARWHELPAPAVFEVRAFKEGAQPQTARFKPEWMDEAVEWISNLNSLGFNTYSTRNPIRADITRSASDEDVIAAFFLWADCDDPTAAGNVYRFDGPKWTAAVTTGRTPSVRVHTYWALDVPCTDLAEWRRVQEDIAAHFASDRSVVNPSRIMRIGGTINHPFKRKQDRGYIPELCTINTTYDQPRSPVSLDQMRRAFGARPEPERSQTGADSAPAFNIDTGQHDRKSWSDYADILRRARTDGEKHTGVRDLAASLAGAGVPQGLAEAIIREACPVWDSNVEDLIRSAYAKFYKAPPPPAVQAAEEAAPAIAPFRAWEPVDEATLPPRDFIYGRHYIRKFVSLTVAPGGLGKSTLVLVEAIAIATGRNLIGIEPKQRQRVVYFNAEDPDDEIKRRVLAVCKSFNISQSELVGWFFQANGRDVNMILSAGENGDIVEATFQSIVAWHNQTGAAVYCFDPLANMTESPETNDVFRRLGKRLSKLADELHCSIEIVHHTRKLGGKDAEVEDSRGGSALIGAVRSARALNPMSPEEAIKAGLETHIDHFRIEAAGKNNMSRPLERSDWYQKISVELANGDSVAALKKWEWPDAFDGVSVDDARKCQAALMNQEPKCSASVQASNWGGHVIGEVLEIDTKDKAGKARVNAIVKAWLQTGVLAVEHVFSKRDGRDKPVLVAGTNDPGVS